jgi:hypothetical protein
MDCFHFGCRERSTWQLKLVYRMCGPGAEPVAVDGDRCACWTHRAQLLRSYAGARGAPRRRFSLRGRGIDPELADQASASLTPIFR